MFVLATLSILLQAGLEAIRSMISISREGRTRAHEPSSVEAQSSARFRLFTRSAIRPDAEDQSQGGIQVTLRIRNAVRTYQLSNEDCFIATESVRLTVNSDDAAQVVTIAESGELPAVIIRIRVGKADKRLTSKLIFTCKSQLRLFRKFGTDMIPIRLTEKINILTDTVKIGESHFISFNQVVVGPLTRATSAP